MFIEEAIQLALESRWADALTTNERLVDTHGPDEGSYNRIGKSLTELGRLEEALRSYGHALELNPLNLIAQKNTRKLAVLLESKEQLAVRVQKVDVDLFTEEPGKSVLTTVKPPKKGGTVKVVPGDIVELEVVDGGLQAHTARGVLIGGVDTKLARRLVPLIATGNRYSAAVARIEDDKLEIMVREEFQSAENVQTSSFPVRGAKKDDFRPYAKESLRASREIDSESQDGDDADELLPAAVQDDDEEMSGMTTFDGDFDEDPPLEVKDDDDDEDDEEDEPAEDTDKRPEDDY